MSSSLQAGSFRCRINFLRMIKELYVATIEVLVRMKARVAATSTSAAARNVGSVTPMYSSESSPMKETWEVVISESVSDKVNLFTTAVQPMLYV